MSMIISRSLINYVFLGRSPDELNSRFNSYTTPGVRLHSSGGGFHHPRAIIRSMTRRRHRKSLHQMAKPRQTLQQFDVEGNNPGTVNVR